MLKTVHSSPAKAFVKHTARQTWSTGLLVALLFGGIALGVISFSGPPAGCTPTSCPANPFKIDFTNGRVGIGKPTPAEKLDVGGNIRASGKVTSASTVASDVATTVVTKDYVDSRTSNMTCSENQATLTSGTVYQNTTGHPLLIVAFAHAAQPSQDIEGSIGTQSNNLSLIATDSSPTSGAGRRSITFMVPRGYYYKVTDPSFLSAHSFVICP